MPIDTTNIEQHQQIITSSNEISSSENRNDGIPEVVNHEEEDSTNPLLNSLEYRGNDQECSSDNESSTRSSVIDETQFNIDWDEVRQGKAAGLPSQWEVVEHHSTSPVVETGMSDLYNALRIKALAYANEEWQVYWNTYGPAYLVDCWKQQYPDISLKRVEMVSGLGFLCENLESKMQLDSEEDNSLVAISDTHIDEKLNNVDDTNVQCTNDDTSCSSNAISDEKILSLWNEFYNSLYWYTFEIFQGPTSAAGDEECIPPELDGEKDNINCEDELEEGELECCDVEENTKVNLNFK